MIAFDTIVRAAVAGAVLTLAAGAAAAPVPALKRAPTVVHSNDGYDRHVAVHNATGWTMLRLYASDSHGSAREADVLGHDRLRNGDHVRLDIDDGSGACLYDLRAEFANGQALVHRRINVCQVADYTYTR